MAVLATCWLIIESIVIPDGFVKWFYLSFYIHPILLFVCQIFLWLKLLQKWLLLAIFYLVDIIFHLSLYLFKRFKNCLTCLFPFTRTTDTEEAEKFEDAETDCENEIVILHTYSSTAIPMSWQQKVFTIERDCFQTGKDLEKVFTIERDCFQTGKDLEKVFTIERDCFQTDKDLEDKGLEENIDVVPREEQTRDETSFCLDDYARTNDYLSSIVSLRSSMDDTDSDGHLPSSLNYSSSPPAEEMDTDTEYPPSVYSSNSPVRVMEGERIPDAGRNDETEEFYKKYTERMSWFDTLNHERTCGKSAILNEQVGTPCSLESVGFSGSPYISWSRMAKNRLLKSLESDFELVYVAQSCLSWEALHHQHKRVEALALSTTSQNGVFQDSMAGEFQKFQVLLERFMEDERCEGKRIRNYVQARFSQRGLLQVPKISGFLEQEREDVRGETINVKSVLKTIEICMEAFWIFVKTDNKRPWWKLKSSLWTSPPIEDPRDLELLADLTRKLQKKELWLKDLQGKRRCWVRRVLNQLEESQRKQMLFTMIDMKLVARVLQMSVISSLQLKWCQEKLDNIEFNQGRIIRDCRSGPLFPC